eukprot:1848839-Alexandrium_andersonii.AAC.1
MPPISSMIASRSSASWPSSSWSVPSASGAGPSGPMKGVAEQRRICPAAWPPMRTSSAGSSSAGSPLPLCLLPAGA